MLGQHTLLSRLKNRLHIRRGIIISFAVSFTATFLLIVLLHPYSKPAPPRFNHYVDHFPTCRSKNMVGSESLWHSAQDKYTSLRDDKFRCVEIRATSPLLGKNPRQTSLLMTSVQCRHSDISTTR